MAGGLILCALTAVSATDSNEAFIRRLDADMAKLTAVYSRARCTGSVRFSDSSARFRFARYNDDWVYEAFDRSKEWQERNYAYPIAVIAKGTDQFGVYRGQGGSVNTRLEKYPDPQQTFSALPFLSLERASITGFKSPLRDWLVKHLESGAMRLAKDQPGSRQVIIEAGTLPDRKPGLAVNRHRIVLQDNGVLAPTLLLHETQARGEKDFEVTLQVKYDYDGEWNGVPKLVRCMAWSPHMTKKTAPERFTLPPNYEWVVDPETGWLEQAESLSQAQLSPKTYGGENVVDPLTLGDGIRWWIWLLVAAAALVLMGVWLRRRARAGNESKRD